MVMASLICGSSLDALAAGVWGVKDTTSLSFQIPKTFSAIIVLSPKNLYVPEIKAITIIEMITDRFTSIPPA